MTLSFLPPLLAVVLTAVFVFMDDVPFRWRVAAVVCLVVTIFGPRALPSLWFVGKPGQVVLAIAIILYLRINGLIYWPRSR
jgi:hypothetical protein